LARRRERSACGRAKGPQTPRTNLHAERGGKNVFELVGLVYDERVVLRKNLPAAAQISAEEVKVHDDDVGYGGPRASSLGETLPARRTTARPGTLIGGDADTGPRGGRRLEVKLGPVAARGRLGPSNKAAHLLPDTARCDSSRGDARLLAPYCFGRPWVALAAASGPGTGPNRVERIRINRRVQALLVAEALQLVEALAA
jgi:hypothetical protein